MFHEAGEYNDRSSGDIVEHVKLVIATQFKLSSRVIFGMGKVDCC